MTERGEYHPSDGSGWEKGPAIMTGVHRYRTPLGGDWYLQVTTSANVFTISRVMGRTYRVPTFDDMARIEKEFGVRGWSIKGVHPCMLDAQGVALVATAEEPK